MSPRVELWTPESGNVEKRRGRTDKPGSGGGGPGPGVGGAFPDPGVNGSGQPNFYLGWAAGPNSPGSGLAYGNQVSQNKISVRHDYSTDASDSFSQTQAQSGINGGCIPTQSVKFGFTGSNISTRAPQLLSGALDSNIDLAAQRIDNLSPTPVGFCFFHEPAASDEWGASSTTRSQYRQCWRYIVNRIRAAGVTNVFFTNCQETPFDFRPGVPGAPESTKGGSRGFNFRELHPDWNGGTTGTSSDWYDDTVLDLFVLDSYIPIVGGTQYNNYYYYWRDVGYQWEQTGYDPSKYGGCGIYEFGLSDIAGSSGAGTPGVYDWNASLTQLMQAQIDYNIKFITYWNCGPTGLAYPGGGTIPFPKYHISSQAGVDEPGDEQGVKRTLWNSIVTSNSRCVVWNG